MMQITFLDLFPLQQGIVMALMTLLTLQIDGCTIQQCKHHSLSSILFVKYCSCIWYMPTLSNAWLDVHMISRNYSLHKFLLNDYTCDSNEQR